jgi:hypothetical protein
MMNLRFALPVDIRMAFIPCLKRNRALPGGCLFAPLVIAFSI